MTVNDLVSNLLSLAAKEPVCILDSCAVSHLGSHQLIGGIEPISIQEVSNANPEDTLSFLDQALSAKNRASIFTISYDLGNKLHGIATVKPDLSRPSEPDVFLAQFDKLIVHDYDTNKSRICGNGNCGDSIRRKLESDHRKFDHSGSRSTTYVRSNFTRARYMSAIETIKEHIRSGQTYQTNLTQQLKAILPDSLRPEQIFWRLRQNHPAPFSAFIKRNDSTVVSASPERFFHIGNGSIEASPIKGTRTRGTSPAEDDRLRRELLTSKKDLAENTMIVDLLRNDLGRVCEFGSINVEKLCDLEQHSTLFHLVSTVSGKLRKDTKISEILRTVFPCGSITGAPKINTMRIINEIEQSDRGLSMGAIGYYIPGGEFGMPETIDLSVAIRTMVIRDSNATFNVGGGIVIDSDPDSEYEESLIKARAILDAIGGRLE